MRHTFHIDMNSVRGDEVGTLLTLAADPLPAQLFPPALGDDVCVVDDEGYRYLATVVAVDDIWLGVSIDRDSVVPPIVVGDFGQAAYAIEKGPVPTKTDAVFKGPHWYSRPQA